MYRKLLRTFQNYFPSLGEVKNEIYHWARTKVGTTHDLSFAALRHLPASARPELLIDVGANRGQSIIAMRRFRPGAPIISFEPNPAMFAWLERRFGDWPDVRLENVALGVQAGVLSLHIPAYRGFTYDGLATTRAEMARSYFSSDTLFGFDPAKISVQEVDTPVRTLDSFGLAPTFIKIDVEGGEFDVLSGAVETLKLWRPTLMIERFYDDPRIPQLLASLGYVQMRPERGRFVPGESTSLNMFWMSAGQEPAVSRVKISVDA